MSCNCVEEWKTMKGARYRVSSKGEVFDTVKNHSVNQFISSGYKRVSLKLPTGWKALAVSRLVALAFISNPEKLSQVDHDDEDRFNNCKCNLGWLSPADNTVKSQAKHYKFTCPTGKVVNVFNMEAFCREQDLSAGCMHHVYRGDRQSHKGWTRCRNQ